MDKHLRYATWISLSRSGIPTCILVHHRRVISGKESRGDALVRFYLSLFSISKLVLLVPKRAKCNYSSIIKDFEPDCGFQSLVDFFYKSTLPSVVISPLSLKFQWGLDFSGDQTMLVVGPVLRPCRLGEKSLPRLCRRACLYGKYVFNRLYRRHSKVGFCPILGSQCRDSVPSKRLSFTSDD